MFFGYAKYHSIWYVLLDLKLPSFNTIMYNFCYVLTFSAIRAILTWLCSIETCIWIFLHTNTLMSVVPVYIMSFSCVLYFPLIGIPVV